MKHRTAGNSRKYNAAWYQALKNEEDSVRGFNSKFKEPGKQFGENWMLVTAVEQLVLYRNWTFSDEIIFFIMETITLLKCRWS